MSKICEITGKKVIRGNNVSHSRIHTKRTFSPNLHTKKFYIPEEDMWITLKVSADEQRMTLAVEDTGTGIPAKEAETIFDRFVKLDTFKEGLGLGLPLCRMIVNRLGGSVNLDTSYKQGARFVVKLNR